jgi:pseudouridine-5'-phosphate glycosidase
MPAFDRTWPSQIADDRGGVRISRVSLLRRTLERLETLGVPGYGRAADAFPAFYRRNSGLPVDARFDRPPASRPPCTRTSGWGSARAWSWPTRFPKSTRCRSRSTTRALAWALAEAEHEGVRGRAVIPYLLERLRALAEGQSVFSNRALLLANARAAGSLAVALAAER